MAPPWGSRCRGERRLAALSQQLSPSHHAVAAPAACADTTAPALRVGVVRFVHETNTFAAEQNIAMDSVNITRGAAMFHQLHPKSFIGGFREVTDQAQQPIELVPGVGIGFSHGGIIGQAVFETCKQEIIDALRGMGQLDAVYFSLHGAAVAEAPYTDAEGLIIREARELLGNSLPMVATYDFHAISSRWENEEGAVPFPHDTNPHIDAYEQGLEAARCLVKMLDGSWAPVTRRLFVPIVGPNIGQSTWSQIPEQEEELLLYQLNQKRIEMEQADEAIINISILGGYGYGDSADAGMSIVATTDDDEELALRICRELGQELWDRRERLVEVRPFFAVDDGVREAMRRGEEEPRGKPVMLVDLGDDPGSACPADSPAVLESLIRLGARDCALTIRDADVVAAGVAAGVGATLTMSVGASVDQRFYSPCEVTGVVRLIDDGNYMILGPTHGGWGRGVNQAAFREANAGPRVVLRIGDKIDVIFSRRSTGKDRDFFKSAGVILEEKRILAVKSNQAHRASFDPVVSSTIELSSPGVSTVDYASLPYKHLQRPIWPIDRGFTWSAVEAEAAAAADRLAAAAALEAEALVEQG